MSPDSPVFHSVVTVRIGLKTKLNNIRYLCWSAERLSFLSLQLKLDLGIIKNALISNCLVMGDFNLNVNIKITSVL